MSDDRYTALLDPVLASLDDVATKSKLQGPQLGDAIDFLQFKLFATLHTGDQIREQLRAGTSTARESSGSIEVLMDRSAKFALYALVDSFLFESGSTKDALLQLVNVAFGLGIATEDTRMAARVKKAMEVSTTSSTGLEPWLEDSCQPMWLKRLYDLRNSTTHRRIVRLPDQYRLRAEGTTPPSWQGRVGIEDGAGGYEDAETFIERTEREMSALLRASLERLAGLL